MRKRTHRSREAVPVTHPKRTVIRFPRGMVDGRIARCVDASGSPKYEYDERFTTLHFTPQEFRQFIRCLDDAGSPSTRRAKELALQQYRAHGGPNVGGLEYLQNPLGLPYGWQDWDRFAKRKGFIEWAEPAPIDASESRYAVVDYSNSIRWARVSPNPDTPVDYSSGAFYDDMPGGAVESAKRAAMIHKKKMASYLLENPTIMGLSGTDVLLFLGGAAAVGLVGYLVYKQQQAAQSQANALTSPELSYAATDINPPPPAVPVPPPPGGYPGTSPLPVPPS